MILNLKKDFGNLFRDFKMYSVKSQIDQFFSSVVDFFFKRKAQHHRVNAF